MYHVFVGRRPTHRRTTTPSSASSTSSASGSSRDRARRASTTAHVFYFAEPLVPHARLQGDAHARPARATTSRDLERPAADQRAVHVPLAVQHQHVPELGAGAPVPDDLPQRRDQHAARQHQLDARPRGALRVGALRAGRRREAPADHPTRASATRPASTTRRAARHGRPARRARR